MSIPSDDRFVNQWYLNNTTPGGLDLNIVEAWDEYTGAGVTVTVIDDGFDYTHTDLAPNYLLDADYNFASGGTDDAAPVAAGDNHGTAVMGIIGAARNGTGVVGVAYDSDLVGFRTDLSLGATLDAIDATADSAAPNFVATDVVSMSFGTTSTFRVTTEDAGMVAGFALGSEVGRDGLGTVYVKSAGNDRGVDDTNAEMRDATPFTITVAAAFEDGSITNYSTPGASVTVTAFGSPGGSSGSGTIETTDRVGAPGYSATDFTSTFNGTSAAAPMVSGVVALMLEANPDLGWRDVQSILALSARHVGSDVGAAATGFEQFSGDRGTTASWIWNDAGNWNGGGMHFSNDYGFGLVDTLAAVRLAETWDLQSTTANRAETGLDVLDTATTITASGSNSFTGTETENVLIEHVVVDMNFLALDDKGDLEVYLTSPGGTVSKLIAGIGGTGAFTGRWEFGSNAFRGESSAGTWTVTVHDNDATGNVQIDDVVVRTYGAAASDDDLFVVTNEFSDYVGVAGHTADFTGGAGTNTLNAAAVTSASTIDLVAGTGTIDGVAVTLSGVQNVHTGDGEDTITTSGAVGEVITTGRGTDYVLVTGLIDGDRYDGGDNLSDRIDWGGSAEDGAVFDLAAGVASVDGGSATMVGFRDLDGTEGDDSITGTDGSNWLKGGGGADTIFDGGGSDLINGQDGDDRIVIGDAAMNGDSYNGSDGIDTFDASLHTWATDVTVDLTAGTWGFGGSTETLNAFENIVGGDGLAGTTETLTGNELANRIAGNGGRDVISGLAGDDMLDGGAGADVLDGGADIDIAVYASSLAGVTISLVSGNAGGGDAAGDMLSNIENVRGSDFADFLKGDGGANRLEGAAGNDRLDGYTGNDTLVGGAGADILNGDAGSDTASYAGSAAGVTISLGSATALGGDAAGDTFSSIENVTGSDFADFLKGDLGVNRLDGSMGDDLLEGGAGGDALIGGSGLDTARYAASAAAVTISLASGNAVGGEAAGDSFSSVENLIGSIYADFLKGDSVANRFEGGLGNDRLEGNDGDDVLAGGTGADVIVGGVGSDTADYSASSAAVTISLPSGNAIGGDATGDTLSGIENLLGSAFADYLKGGAGANRLNGGDGDDKLEGGAGADALIGGAGSDTADYVKSAAGVTISLTTGNAVGGDAGGDSFVAVENLTGSAFADYLKGDAAANTLVGNAGADILEGMAGADILTGGAGSDRFLFRDGDGSDRITDFVAGAGSDDTIDLSRNSLLNSFAEVLAHASQSGADTLLDMGGTDILTLAGVTRTALHQDDFVF